MPTEYSNDTEKDIFDALESAGAIGSDDDDATPATTQTPEDDGEGAETGQQPSAAPADGSAADDGARPQAEQAQQPVPTPAQAQQQVATQQQPQQQQQPPKLWNHPQLQNYFLDENKNVTDRHGNIIAHAGGERRWFENSAALQHYMSQRQQYTENLETRLRDTLSQSKEALNGLPAQLGLSAEDAEFGMNIVAQFKKDPVTVARYVLAETAKLGYNVSQITGAEGSNSIDMQAITRLLDERLGPVAQQRQETQQQSTAEETARIQAERFMQQFPDAAPHHNEIAGIVMNARARGQNISPEQAYFELRHWATVRGLDWSQPLRQQVVAAQAQPQPNGAQPQPPGNPASQTAPLPNGGMPLDSVTTNTPRTAQDDEDYDSIIRGAMRDAGMRVT